MGCLLDEAVFLNRAKNCLRRRSIVASRCDKYPSNMPGFKPESALGAFENISVDDLLNA
jgi:hypothetical protein